MNDGEKAASQTCDVLSASQLKAICRYRGFSPPSGPKDLLTAFLAPRLLEPTGVTEAVATLEKKWILALYRIALFDDSPGLDQLHEVLQPGQPTYRIDHRALFRQVAESLLSRGVVLVKDPPMFGRSHVSRYARLTFHLADSHRPLLPPFPVATWPLGKQSEAADLHTFCIKVLKAGARRASGLEPGPTTGFLGQVVAGISISDGALHWGKAAIPDWPAFARVVRDQWTEGPTDVSDRLSCQPGFRTAAKILGRLSAGEGTTVEELRAALVRLSVEPKAMTEDKLSRFCEDGVEAGLLVGSGRRTPRCYAVAQTDDCPSAQQPISFGATGDGIEVDLDRSGLSPLLELAAVSILRAVKGGLHLIPDVLRLGRVGDNLGTLAALDGVRAGSPAFDLAVREVKKRHGRLLLHQGLIILRIEDLGLRTALMHRMPGDLRTLGGPYLAAPRALSTEIEKIVRKEGYAPRRIS